MEKRLIYITNVTSEDDLENLRTRLLEMISVNEVVINFDERAVNFTFETPTNLNALEKEIYDAGYHAIDDL
ncbi:putative copper chaperone CsoZ [Staphylococcus lugdunensis]|uniref:putative copper chaperone CsoZ n=1 Tax=Staphylococcus lugdunensis TaxID=28035 RepID=UPI001F56AC13|nr:heavy-metal-associated domain-containing protein [Staphylococcus lugdunensis]MCI2794628.1 heavy-metal-associated domain-containing protein [Staphylococcus lugdunensis]MCI2796718.1 heavy-metal-associated domain-containing protein [Staphylococcus lugdunensis]